MTFCQHELDLFHQQGFIKHKKILGDQALTILKEIAIAHVEQKVLPYEKEIELAYPGAPTHQNQVGADTIRRLLQAYDRHEYFRSWGLHPKIHELLTQLFGTKELCLARAHHNCIMTKQPQFSSQTGWHQDIRYWSFNSDNMISVWLALGEETDENGALRFIPGSHTMSFTPDQFDTQKFFRNDLPKNQALIATQQTATMKAGEFVFFHAKTLHAAHKNLLDQTKYALVFTYHTKQNLPLPNTRSASIASIPFVNNG